MSVTVINITLMSDTKGHFGDTSFQTINEGASHMWHVQNDSTEVCQ